MGLDHLNNDVAVRAYGSGRVGKGCFSCLDSRVLPVTRAWWTRNSTEGTVHFFDVFFFGPCPGGWLGNWIYVTEHHRGAGQISSQSKSEMFPISISKST